MNCEGQPGRETGFAEEQEAIAERRRVAGIAPDAPIIGLALSGGGVRSATFCLGLMRGLAQNGILSRFDYLSSVSGGGYIGAAFGRLVAQLGIRDAEKEVASGDSRTLEWLRRNGRYLTPKGARDIGVAVATYMRAAVAIHLEVGALALLVGVIVVLPHAFQIQRNLLDPLAWRPWITIWWPIAVAYWLAMAPGAMSAFWSLRDFSTDTRGKRIRTIVVDVAVVAFIGLTVWWLVWGHPWECGAADTIGCKINDYLVVPLRAAEFRWVFILALLSIVIRGASTYVRLLLSRAQSRRIRNVVQRKRLTLSLRMTNTIALVLVIAGAFDLITWQLKEAFGRGPAWLFGSVGLGTVVVAFGRSMLEPLQKLTERTEGSNLSFGTVMNLVGILIGAALLIGWATFVQWFVFATAVQGAPSWLPDNRVGRAGMLALLPVAWILLTAANREATNTSSLHSFYRGRLTRAYLRVGNKAFWSGTRTQQIQDVAAIEEEDDVPLAGYAPELGGGPIHLVNTCINQTRAAASGMYNADRKGMRLTASRFGLEVGNDLIPMPKNDSASSFGTLGQWTAISGAAASPGAGSYTSTGWALLLFMTGVRLGYWFPSASSTPSLAASRFTRFIRDTKYGRLTSEALARFHGTEDRAWFLSDGGHFENTGVHALLKRQAAFIVVADCGADPEFEMGDLENLIRKARIDYDAEIEFYPENAPQLSDLRQSQISVLAPEQIRSNYSARGILLARITYRDGAVGPAAWKQGTMLIVKPNLHEVLDPDVLAYARRNTAFPQQSTSDQFFDEAQWESYQRLGEDFGRALTSSWLSQLPCWSSAQPCADPVEPLRAPRKREDEAVPAKPFWRTEAKAAALGATLGVSALAALALPAWQVISEVRAQHEGLTRNRADLVDRAYKVAPAWAREGQQPKKLPDDLEADFATRQPILQLYEAVKDESRTDTHDAAIALIDTLQAACNISAPAPTMRQRCPEVSSLLCRSVCDPDDPEDSYWPTPRQATASGAAPLVTVTKEELKEARVSLDAAVSGTPERPLQIASAAGPVDTGPPQIVVSPATEVCKGRKLYAHVYDDTTRQRVSDLQWKDLNGAELKGVENVVATALARGRRPPYRWSQPTLVVHHLEADGECAAEIQAFVQNRTAGWYAHDDEVGIRKLPSGFNGETATIELWFPSVREADEGVRAVSAR
jgi:hypothetical protein